MEKPIQVAVNYNADKARIELLFSEVLPKEVANFLKESVGLHQHFQEPKQWIASNHPAYHKYAHALENELPKGGAIQQVGLTPSFEPSEENIDKLKFSYVSITFSKEGATTDEHYVLFDSYKKVATFIAERFARQKYGSSLKEVVVHSRNYKRKARALLRKEQIIKSYDMPLSKDETPKEKLPAKEAVSDLILKHGIIPEQTQEPFASGKTFIKHAAMIQKLRPNLMAITDDTLHQATALELFELSQMSHPTDFGFQVNRGALLKEWSNRGTSLFETLGYPTDNAYPYMNIHTGLKSVHSLGHILGHKHDSWWTVVEHYRPLANPNKFKNAIDLEISSLLRKSKGYINPKTLKPFTNQKETHEALTYEISSLRKSKKTIAVYLDTQQESAQEKPSLDHLDQIIAHMHDAYSECKRMTKGQILKLADTFKILNKGMLWEAVELSWMLWYRNIYLEPIDFEQRLKKMIHFWQQLQPTYAYSDSTKEIYKQYSTPCPISAILAQYTRMDSAQQIFEPSAGNGLLLVGANPNKTHVNEIDKSRLDSLRFQQYKTITTHNAVVPFPKELAKSFDVVVTNPPFASWEDSKWDKKQLVNTYFNKHIGLEQHMRLEHLMCGLALNTLKNDGHAAMIIMGHIYFGKDGLIAKYRPFFNWLFRHYHVDDIINLNSYKLYNKQGAVAQTMLILISGRKAKPEGVAPNQAQANHFYPIVDSFQALWQRVQPHLAMNILIQQLKTALKHDIL